MKHRVVILNVLLRTDPSRLDEITAMMPGGRAAWRSNRAKAVIDHDHFSSTSRLPSAQRFFNRRRIWVYVPVCYTCNSIMTDAGGGFERYSHGTPATLRAQAEALVEARVAIIGHAVTARTVARQHRDVTRKLSETPLWKLGQKMHESLESETVYRALELCDRELLDECAVHLDARMMDCPNTGRGRKTIAWLTWHQKLIQHEIDVREGRDRYRVLTSMRSDLIDARPSCGLEILVQSRGSNSVRLDAHASWGVLRYARVETLTTNHRAMQRGWHLLVEDDRAALHNLIFRNAGDAIALTVRSGGKTMIQIALPRRATLTWTPTTQWNITGESGDNGENGYVHVDEFD